MIISNKEVRKKFKALWFGLEYIWLFDKSGWSCPTLDQVKEALATSKVPGMDWVDEFNDCDDFALHFLSEFKRKRYFSYKVGNIPKEDLFPSAIFNVFGDRFRGKDSIHMLNAVICSDGYIYMVDATPYSKAVWKATSFGDNVLFVSSV